MLYNYFQYDFFHCVTSYFMYFSYWGSDGESIWLRMVYLYLSIYIVAVHIFDNRDYTPRVLVLSMANVEDILGNSRSPLWNLCIRLLAVERRFYVALQNGCIFYYANILKYVDFLGEYRCEDRGRLQVNQSTASANADAGSVPLTLRGCISYCAAILKPIDFRGE